VTFAGGLLHPVESLALQVNPLMTDTTSPSMPATYTVSVCRSMSAQTGPGATLTVGAVAAHPLMSFELHVAMLTTETVLSLLLVTYAVWVAWSIAIESGLLPSATSANEGLAPELPPRWWCEGVLNPCRWAPWV
jgi:hypothetical protein